MAPLVVGSVSEGLNKEAHNPLFSPFPKFPKTQTFLSEAQRKIIRRLSLPSSSLIFFNQSLCLSIQSQADRTVKCGHKYRQNVFHYPKLVCSSLSERFLRHWTSLIYHTRSLQATIRRKWSLTAPNSVHHPFNGGRHSSSPGGASDSPYTK